MGHVAHLVAETAGDPAQEPQIAAYAGIYRVDLQVGRARRRGHREAPQDEKGAKNQAGNASHVNLRSRAQCAESAARGQAKALDVGPDRSPASHSSVQPDPASSARTSSKAG